MQILETSLKTKLLDVRIMMFWIKSRTNFAWSNSDADLKFLSKYLMTAACQDQILGKDLVQINFKKINFQKSGKSGSNS